MQTSTAVKPAGRVPAFSKAMRVAVVCDFAEENWPSMDLVGEMIAASLREMGPAAIEVSRLCPAATHRAGRVPFLGASRIARNADRLLNRFVDYHRYLRAQSGHYDLFHIADHSYAQLAHAVPPGRTVVTCHDLDTFRCLLQPERDPRPAAFRLMAARTLSGLRRAAAIACVSSSTADELRASGVIAPQKIHVIPNGVHPAFTAVADERGDAQLDRLLGPRAGAVELLHVGSTIARKRIDVLLRVLSELVRRVPEARLIRVGGPFDAEQRSLAAALGVDGRITGLPFLDTSTLGAMYRRAALVVLPSEREGFGLPIIEALACGTPVLASDLPVLREVGQNAVSYCPPGDVARWAGTIAELLNERRLHPRAWTQRRAAGLERAAAFSWQQHAKKLMTLYSDVLAA